MTSALNCRSRAVSSEHRSAQRLAPLLCAVLAACATLRPDAAPAPTPVWPEAPARARIALVSTFARPADLGIEPSTWRRLANLITGGDEPRLVRPLGVAATAHRVAVADPGAARVLVFDLQRRRAIALRACGDAPLREPVAVAFLAARLYVSDAAAAEILVYEGDRCVDRWPLAAGARPGGLAADAPRQRLYVADAGAHRVIAFDARGAVTLEIGRRGHRPGEFNFPTWVAVDDTGEVYVTDALNFRVQRFDPSGNLLGSFGVHGDGSGEMARPKGIALGPGGAVYLVDALFDAVQIFDRGGDYLMMFGGRGEEPGHLWLPAGIAIAGERVYVADSYNRRVQIFRILGEAE